MGGLLEAASSGAFTVNETGGKALLAAIRDMAAWVDENLADLNTSRRGLPLGKSNGALLMKPYMQQVFTDDEGFGTRLKEFRASLVDAEAAITEAMKHYRATEGDIQGTFRAV